MGYQLQIDSVGQMIEVGGYVTSLRHILVGGTTPAEIEALLGYTPASLHAGYWLLGLSPQSHIGPDEFEFRGYTHLEDGKPKGSAQNVHDTLMSGYSAHPVDQQIKRSVITKAVARLNAQGLDRTCKVYPIHPDQVDYKPGSGVPQYVLTKAKTFEVLAQVTPGMRLAALAPGMVRSVAI